ncbi:glycosyltransferase [uncultured Winogradskyella sp.]|uniref:glycosyltransferase n=1 Tax=uncultured Winogradskyella sp. TaxID=395353 RepID=UPI00260C1DF3|nr:glycosyltransferase [uncultured Winogradskyella sp.]
MKTKIFFVLPTLFAGGAERVISFVCQNLDKEKYDAKLIVIGFEKDSKFKVNNVPVIYLNKPRVSNSILPLFKLFLREKPEIVLSSISHLNSLMGLISFFFKNIKFIGRQATINKVADNYRAKRKKSFLFSLINLSDIGIKNLDHVICQSSDMKIDFLECYNFNAKNITIIHNPLTQINIIKHKEEKSEFKKFITIGRLSKIKGQLRLLEVLSKVNFPFKFTIIGNGALKDEIYHKIKALKLEQNVEHIEYTDKVFDYLIKNDMFLQGSYSEGFPNALLESCSVGVPVIAFNAPGGTKEIIKNGVNGFIVENEEEFLAKLNEDVEWNPKTVRDYVYDKFNSNKILTNYEDLFMRVLKD